MVKSELINLIAEKLTHLPAKDIEAGINQILACMSTELCNDNGRVEIRGFGSFCLHYRSAHHARNPKTGKEVATTPKYTPHFKPGKELRQRVNAKLSTGVMLKDDLN